MKSGHASISFVLLVFVCPLFAIAVEPSNGDKNHSTGSHVQVVSVESQKEKKTAPTVETLPISRPLSTFNESLTSSELTNKKPDQEGRQRMSDYCHLVMINLGWLSCGEVHVVTSPKLEPILDEVQSNEPQIIEWGTEEQKELMRVIEIESISRLDKQSEVLDLPIFFQGWMVQPQLTPNHRYIYFATHSLWYNKQVIHLQARTLDGKSFLMVSIETPNQEKSIDEDSALRLIYQILTYHQTQVKT